MGRRVAKKINGVVVEKYLWAGMTNLLAVYEGTGALRYRFDGPKMMKGYNTYYLVTDQIGTVRAVADGAGRIVKRLDYDSFGNLITVTDNTNYLYPPLPMIPTTFANGLYDPDTKLIRFGLRDYDPETGRWTAKDPIGFAGGDDL